MGENKILSIEIKGKRHYIITSIGYSFIDMTDYLKYFYDELNKEKLKNE